MQRCGCLVSQSARRISPLRTPKSRRFASFLQPESYVSSSTPFDEPRLPLKEILEDISEVIKNAQRREVVIPGLRQLPALASEAKELRKKIDELFTERNQLADRIKRLSSDNSEEAKSEKASLTERAREIRPLVQPLQTAYGKLQQDIHRIVMSIPNWSHYKVVTGGYYNIKEIATGGPRRINADKQRDHTKIASDLGLLDLTSAAITTGNSWYYLLREAVSLEQALVNYAFSMAASDGWTMATTPDVIKSDLAWRCGFQPREDDAGQTFFVESSSTRAKNVVNERQESDSNSQPAQSEPESLVLAGTAEIPLAGLFAFRTLKPDHLPMTVVGLGKAFRAEAGARGAQTRGLYRVHQFTKVELFAVTNVASSEAMMERMLNLQRRIIDGLNVPYRVLDMPSAELGASAWRKYDIEAFMPGRGEWGEISSLSNCTDYQSRRLLIEYAHSQSKPKAEQIDGENPKDSPEKLPKRRFAHTLNGTAAAVPRLIVALVENGAVFEDGKAVALRLPETLRRFWIGSEDRVQWVPAGRSLSQ